MVGKQITLAVTAIHRMIWIFTYEMKLKKYRYLHLLSQILTRLRGANFTKTN